MVVLGNLSDDPQALATAFKIFDIDGSNGISLEELQSAFKVLGVPCAPNKMVKLFRDADVDGSGEIDFDEFCAVIAKGDGGALAVITAKVAEDKSLRAIMKERCRPSPNRGTLLSDALSDVRKEREWFHALSFYGPDASPGDGENALRAGFRQVVPPKPALQSPTKPTQPLSPMRASKSMLPTRGADADVSPVIALAPLPPSPLTAVRASKMRRADGEGGDLDSRPTPGPGLRRLFSGAEDETKKRSPMAMAAAVGSPVLHERSQSKPRVGRRADASPEPSPPSLTHHGGIETRAERGRRAALEASPAHEVARATNEATKVGKPSWPPVMRTSASEPMLRSRPHFHFHFHAPSVVPATTMQPC